MRERHRDERLGVGDAATDLRLQRRARPGGARRAVVAVGNVERRYARESIHGGARIRSRHPPDRVLHAIGRREIVEGRSRCRPRRFGVRFRRRAIGQKDDARLRPQLDDVPRAIVLLVAPSPLVFLDDVLIVLVDGKASGDTRLFVRAHAQPVEVERRRVLDDERRLRAKPGKIRAGQVVDARRVGIGPGRQIDLGARDVKKTERIAVGELPRFVHAHDIVGNRGHGRRDRRRRAQSPERMERRHDVLTCRSGWCL